MVAFDPKTEKMETVKIPTPGSVVRHMETDSTRHRIWLALSGTGRLGKIQLGQ
jgi:streptogramin lyase